jgi:putative ABC transport system permease protein
VGITDQDRSGIAAFMEQREGLREFELIPSVDSRLLKVDGNVPRRQGRDPEDREDGEDRNRGGREFTLTWRETLPPDTSIVKGKWWQPPYAAPLVSVEDYAAERYGIGLGSVLEFGISGQTVRAEVANIRNTEFPRPGGSNWFILSPGALEGFPATYIGTVRAPAGDVPGLQSDLFKRFPNVTSIDVGDVLARVQDLLDKISGVVRFMALFAIASGLIILASSVTSTRYRRIRETMLFRILGATRFQLRCIQAVELMTIGSASGFIGGLLAAAAAHLLLGNLLDTEFDLSPVPLLAGILAAAVLTTITGWLAAWGILKQKPLEVLREN